MYAMLRGGGGCVFRGSPRRRRGAGFKARGSSIFLCFNSLYPARMWFVLHLKPLLDTTTIQAEVGIINHLSYDALKLGDAGPKKSFLV